MISAPSNEPTQTQKPPEVVTSSNNDVTNKVAYKSFTSPKWTAIIQLLILLIINFSIIILPGIILWFGHETAWEANNCESTSFLPMCDGDDGTTMLIGLLLYFYYIFPFPLVNPLTLSILFSLLYITKIRNHLRSKVSDLY